MGQYQFREQLNMRGCYCKISLSAKFVECENRNLRIDYYGEPRWEYSCMAGIYIFYDYFTNLKKGELEVTIVAIDWMPVDTNHLIVLYSVIRSLSKELQIDIVNLEFDKDRQVFIFPEPRILLQTK